MLFYPNRYKVIFGRHCGLGLALGFERTGLRDDRGDVTLDRTADF